MEELKKRHGIVGDKSGYFKVYIRLHLEGQLCHNYADNLIGLAQYIVNREELYISKHGGYKKMEFSSILTNLRKIHKQESVLWEKEKLAAKAEVDKYKSKKS